MKRALIVVDMQNDFITGSLANTEGQKIVPAIAELIRNFDGDIIVTRDTHDEDYMSTQEGKRLPVPHCIKGTEGFKIVPEIQEALDSRKGVTNIYKQTFGSISLGEYVGRNLYDEVELVGVCTDICVINSAMVIKACTLDTTVAVRKDLCAGVTKESHENALKAMEACQIDII